MPRKKRRKGGKLLKVEGSPTAWEKGSLGLGEKKKNELSSPKGENPALMALLKNLPQMRRGQSHERKRGGKTFGLKKDRNRKGGVFWETWTGKYEGPIIPGGKTPPETVRRTRVVEKK